MILFNGIFALEEQLLDCKEMVRNDDDFSWRYYGLKLLLPQFCDRSPLDLPSYWKIVESCHAKDQVA